MSRANSLEHRASFHRFGWLALAAGVVVAGCGPSTNYALEAARRDYIEAQSDPKVAEHASSELYDARVALNKAENEFSDGDETETVHYARVAETQIQRARYAAKGTTAENESERLKSDTQRLAAELAAFKARETAEGLALTMSDVQFETGSAQLTADAMSQLSRLASFLVAHPDRTMVIEGHTDNVGSADYNVVLSRRRAESVEHFLAASGVDPARLQARGFGESYPVASNASAMGRAENRRVEMLVANPGQVVTISSRPIVRTQEVTTVTRY